MQERLKSKTRMIRKQVYITPEQQRQLRERAAAAGVPEAELIRAGIDKQLVETAQADPDAWRRIFDDVSPSWAEREDLQEEIAQVRAEWSKKVDRHFKRAPRKR